MLSNLTSQNLELEPLRVPQSQCSAKHLKTIQEHAKNLYDLINQGWTCRCRESHRAHLRLDSRLFETVAEGKLDSSAVNFGVVFSTDDESTGPILWSWQETEIRLFENSEEVGTHLLPSTEDTLVPREKKMEPQSESTSPNLLTRASAFFKKSPVASKEAASKLLRGGVRFDANLPKPSTNKSLTASATKLDLSQLAHIKNLCLTIQDCMKFSICNDYCMGYLSFDGKLQGLAVYPSFSPKGQKPEQRLSVISLADLLSRQKGSYTLHPKASPGTLSLSRADRLELALTISSSILQLHDTPWLREESLCKNDIQLLTKGDENENNIQAQQYAFVFSSFRSRGRTMDSKATKQFPGIPRNPMLFALSILLIELCLGQPFESFSKPGLDPLDAKGEANVLTEMSTAARLLEDVYQEAGNRYGDAVRRCLHCDFNQRKTSLDDDRFRQAVYEGVVVPIRDVVRDFKDLR
jgi:hypothetical protein